MKIVINDNERHPRTKWTLIFACSHKEEVIKENAVIRIIDQIPTKFEELDCYLLEKISLYTNLDNYLKWKWHKKRTVRVSLLFYYYYDLLCDKLYCKELLAAFATKDTITRNYTTMI